MRVRTLSLLKKNIVVWLILGIIYFFMECVERWYGHSLVGLYIGDLTNYSDQIVQPYINSKQTFTSLTGWSSFWMVLVGGLCGVGIAAVAKAWWTDKWPIILKSAFGVVFIVWPLEFLSGLILNIQFGLGIWDYGNKFPAIMGQITLAYFPVFLAVAILAIWIDEAVRHWILEEPKPEKFSAYLKKVITFK